MSEKSKQRAQIEEKAIINRKQLHKGKILTFVIDQIDYGDNNMKSYDLVLHPGAVVMIPIDKQGRIVFIKQWRRPTNQIILELPAGTLDSEEKPEVCALRELQEEIGHGAKKITFLNGFYTAPGFCDEYLHLFLAEGLYHDPLMGDDFDDIDSFPLTLSEALLWIEEGKIIDAKTILGIYRYARMIQQ